jgi:predicted ATPase
MRAKKGKADPPDLDAGGFLQLVMLLRDRVPSFKRYPFSIPAVRELHALELHPKVTFFVGENGSGKSTLVEAIAVAAGFNAEGGSKGFNFATRRSESELHEALQLVRGVRREQDGFFMRAESLFNVATQIEELEIRLDGYGGKSLHNQSHGESFIALATNRFRGNGLYIMDEPEAALSPSRQLALLKLIHALVEKKRSQFIIATHSPILMAYPNATIYHLSPDGIVPIAFEETEHYRITTDFLANRERYFRYLFTDGD